VSADPVIGRDKYQEHLRVQALREELDKLGYHVVPKDHVRKFGAMCDVSDQERFGGHWPKIRPRLTERLGMDIGQGIFRSGAMLVSEENGFGGYQMRAEVSILLHNPTFDKPVWAK
jgi:hypothetical protein